MTAPELFFGKELRRFFGSLFCGLPTVAVVVSCFDDTESSKSAGADPCAPFLLRGALGFAGGGFKVNE